MTRRSFLAFVLAGCATAKGAAPGLRLSIASYILRFWPLDEALATIAGWGIDTVELNPHHLAFDGDLAAARESLARHGVTAWAYGVYYPEKHGAPEPAFEFCRAMGIRVLSCDAADLDPIEALAARTGVRVGIHNHGPKSRYATLGDLQRAFAGRHANVGATVDTGHVVRAGEEPAAWIYELGPRVHGCHLKDVEPGPVLRALRDIGFDGAVSIEHEAPMERVVEEAGAYLRRVREAT